MIILTLNCGSSSLKYQVFDWTNQTPLANGNVERIGLDDSFIGHTYAGKEVEFKFESPTHKEAIQMVIDTISIGEHAVAKLSDIAAVGHRVVHGGEKFKKSVLIDDEVIAELESIQDLAPLHNPANILGIRAAQAVLPNVPHAAVMDTAWHQTMPASSYMYALPYEWYRSHGVRRYGFHGTSVLYTAKRAAVLLGKKPEETNLIIAHVGNGASISAVKDGCAFDTSMGLTPLEGLVMGTRSGDIDPAIPFYIMNQTGMTAKEVETALNKKSGVLGISEKYVDRRDIANAAAEGDTQAQLALDIESYRIKKFIGSYSAALGKVDAIVLTAGAGERNAIIRELALSGLENIGIKLDKEKNNASITINAETCISTDDSPVKVFVIPTDEELVMTEDTYALTQGNYDVHTNFTYSFQNKDYVNKKREAHLPKDLAKFPGLKDIIVSA